MKLGQRETVNIFGDSLVGHPLVEWISIMSIGLED